MSTRFYERKGLTYIEIDKTPRAPIVRVANEGDKKRWPAEWKAHVRATKPKARRKRSTASKKAK